MDRIVFSEFGREGSSGEFGTNHTLPDRRVMGRAGSIARPRWPPHHDSGFRSADLDVWADSAGRCSHLRIIADSPTRSWVCSVSAWSSVHYLVWRLRGRKTRDPNLPPHWGLLLHTLTSPGSATFCSTSTNNYGVRPSGRFGRWYSGHRLLVERFLLLASCIGLVVRLGSLINEEIVPPKGKGRWAATVALMVSLGVGVRDYTTPAPVSALEARTYQAPADPGGRYPTGDPSNGMVVENRISSPAQIDPPAGSGSRRKYGDPLQNRRNTVTLAAKIALGPSVPDWARFPTTETEPLPRRYLVVRDWLDQPCAKWRKPLSGGVELDRNLKVWGVLRRGPQPSHRTRPCAPVLPT